MSGGIYGGGCLICFVFVYFFVFKMKLELLFSISALTRSVRAMPAMNIQR